MLWETCCVPSMMHGAGTWVEMSKSTEKRLNKLQCWFVRLILKIGQGSTVSGLLWDTALLDFGLRVWIEKVMLIIHIRSLDENALARRVYEEQKKNSWPGLASETSLLCQTLSIEDCNLTKLGKTSYRKILLPACHKKNEEKLRNFAKGKCERINHEEYGKKNI